MFVFLFLAGLVAGLIDSIAGGGGLITVPSLMLVIGSPLDSVGTNKIAGGAAALTALLVYWRHGHVRWRESVAFVGWIATGSFVGSRVSPRFPPETFRILLLATCPLILWIVWNREMWVESASRVHVRRGPLAVAIAGLLCGFYDGAWGPGGGTFMFLSLRFAVGMPLFAALGATKLANTASALISLGSYAQNGNVRWPEGGAIGLGITLGALVGASLATKWAARLVRPVLAVVTALLLVKLFA